MVYFRRVLVVAATGAASAAAFTAPPAGIPRSAGNGAALRAASNAAPRSARTASLSLEMARVPFIAGNWKMNPTSVEEVCYVCLCVFICVCVCLCLCVFPTLSPPPLFHNHAASCGVKERRFGPLYAVALWRFVA